VDLCKATLIGNVGRDPEMRYTQAGKPVLSFSVACNRLGPPAPDGGERERITEWFNITCFGRLAEVYANIVTKGNRVYVEGRLQSRRYTRNDGQPGFSLDLIASELHVFNRQRPDEMGMDQPVGAGMGMRSMHAPAGDPDNMDDVPF
jgi:single-strand DNA-binding protein